MHRELLLLKQINRLMIKKKIISIILFLFICTNLNADNYVSNVSSISNLAESSVSAAVSQMNSDTTIVLKNLNEEIQALSSSDKITELALDTSIIEAKKVIEFAQESIEKGDLTAAVQSLNLVESVAEIALTSLPSNSVLENISIDDDFSKQEITALTSVAGQMAIEKVLDAQEMAGQMNVVSKAGLDTSEMMKNLDDKGLGIGTTLKNLDNAGIVNIENITGQENFQIENFDPNSFSSMDIVEIGMILQ